MGQCGLGPSSACCCSRLQLARPPLPPSTTPPSIAPLPPSPPSFNGPSLLPCSHPLAARFVTYKWPSWLHKQTEKQRIIWAYKILFLDVLFPLGLKKASHVPWWCLGRA